MRLASPPLTAMRLHTIALIWITIAATVKTPAVRAQTADSLIGELQRRYQGRVPARVAYTQQVTYHDGRPAEESYQVIQRPGMVRSDLDRNGVWTTFIIRNDTLHLLQDGALKSSRRYRSAHTIVLHEMPTIPIARLRERLASIGVKSEVVSRGTLDGVDAWIIGAIPGDTLTPQVWVEAERLVPIRLIERAGSAGVNDTRFGGFERTPGGGWQETTVRVFSGGKPVVSEVYVNVRYPDTLPSDLFSPVDPFLRVERPRP